MPNLTEPALVLVNLSSWLLANPAQHQRNPREVLQQMALRLAGDANDDSTMLEAAGDDIRNLRLLPDAVCCTRQRHGHTFRHDIHIERHTVRHTKRNGRCAGRNDATTSQPFRNRTAPAGHDALTALTVHTRKGFRPRFGIGGLCRRRTRILPQQSQRTTGQANL